MRRLLTLTVGLLAAASAAAGAYKWVDKDGNVHYSDKPVEGAETVELPQVGSFEAPPAPPRRAPATREAGQDDEAGRFQYQSVDFISPKPDQVFWATGGNVPVYLNLEPALQPGHSIRLYFNGNLTDDSPLSGPSATLTGVHRGAHTVRAVVVDVDDREVASAGPVTFHVKQQSIPNPRTGQTRTRNAAGN